MNVHDEITIPGQEVRHGETPAWLAGSPIWPAVKAQTDGGQLYRHQAMGLELLDQGHNLVISTGTASGKSLVFQAPTLHHLATHPNATAIAIYPIKALARDQVLRWRNLAEAAGVDPAGINRIDGDVRDLTERRQILQRTRLALMTPDVIQQWLMAYSEPLYHRRPLRDDLREVQNTQYNVRRFLSNLAFLILDEVHTYDGALGTHCLYLLHRLQQKRKELMAQFEPLRFIAASATIHNPAQHLETLTGLPFQVVDDRYDGSPCAELTVQHAIGREPHDEGWRDLQTAVREVINDDPNRSYIAFVDDRQLAERAAAGIEAARSITEDAIIVESRDAMAYRSGLMRRERIEEALRAGDIRGIASTSAMEMGIDIPDLQVGFNLGLPHSVGRIRQRAGRVGRTGPGRFIIVAPRRAFQFHEDSLAAYWGQPVEPGRLYPANPVIKNTHGRCLAKETDLNGMERSIPSPTDAWPEQLPQTAAGDRPWRPLRAGVPDGRPAAAPPQRHPGRRRRAGAHPAGHAGRRDGAPHQRGHPPGGGPGRLSPGHLLPRQAVLHHPGLARVRQRDGDHRASRSAPGNPAHHTERRHRHPAAAPRVRAGPLGVLHPRPGGGLGADRGMLRPGDGRRLMARRQLRRRGYPRGGDRSQDHPHPDHHLGGLVRRRQHAAGRGPGLPDRAVQPGSNPSRRHTRHAPERPGYP